MDIKVITGANYGDEGKGMTAYALATEAARQNKTVLSVLYNGGVQRGHTANGQVVHCIGAGDLAGGRTYYDEKFVVDPIALWITHTQVYIHPNCRIVLPCDVMKNRSRELDRGAARHGSCGMGIFECVKRSKVHSFLAKDIFNSELIAAWSKMLKICNKIKFEYDDVYNTENMLRAFEYMKKSCEMKTLEELACQYDELIFEGGQGLLLDQTNEKDFPHLTPSSVGSFNIANKINTLGAENIDVFYVSRSYMTRHGAGPMDSECTKEDINSDIVDKTNLTNEWQGSLRFGYLDQDKLYRRIKGDFSRYNKENTTMNILFTQMNYTCGKIASGKDEFIDVDIEKINQLAPNTSLWLSDQKDFINKIS